MFRRAIALSMVGWLVACGGARPNRGGFITGDQQVSRRSSPPLQAEPGICPADFVAKTLETRFQEQQMRNFPSNQNALYLGMLCRQFLAFNISACRVQCAAFREKGNNNNLAAMALCPSRQGQIWAEPRRLMAACSAPLQQ